MDKIWLKYYQKGVQHTIDPDSYDSLVALFEEVCQRYAHQVAYINFGSTLTYGQLDKASLAFARYLQQLGLKPGARVALMMPNILQYPVALFGVLRAGLVVVNTNPLYKAHELSHQLNNSGAEAIVVMANFALTVEKALPSTNVKHVIITELGDMFSPIKRWIMNAVNKYIKKGVPPYQIPNTLSWRKALQLGGKGALKPVKLHSESLAFLQYTGGTNGVPKGAALTHRNMIANILQASAWITPLQVGTKDLIVTALPLYHIFSLTANCLVFLKAGARNLLITNPRDTRFFVRTIKKIQFTALTGVNTLFNALLHHPDFHRIDFSKLKLTLSGGMALQKSVALKWGQLTKTRILEAYGLTEASPAVSINPLYVEDYNGSIGLPLPSTEVSIRNDAEQEVPFGEAGELCVRGPQVMSEYWQAPEETRLVFTEDGFLKTGDIVKMDEEGFIYIVDRKKDMIDVSGFNVYPNEIEQVIAQHPGVFEVGVIGVTDKNGAERVKACIVKRDPMLTADSIIAYCKEHLTAYKVPKLIEFYKELPKTNVGKILRRALKEESATENIPS